MILLCYHDISRTPKNEWAVTPELFKRHIELLVEHGYHFSTMEDLLTPRDLPFAKCVVVTFDDGRLGAFQYAPSILADHDCLATYYVTPEFVDGNAIPKKEAYSEFMAWKQIQELQEIGHTIGSHGLTHRSLITLLPDAVSYELSESKRRLQDRLNTPCRHFAAPYGQIDKRICCECAAQGYVTAASTVHGSNDPVCDAFFLRRIVVHSDLCEDNLCRELERIQARRTVFRVAHVKRRIRHHDVLIRLHAFYACDTVICEHRQDFEALSRYEIRIVRIAELIGQTGHRKCQGSAISETDLESALRKHYALTDATTVEIQSH